MKIMSMEREMVRGSSIVIRWRSAPFHSLSTSLSLRTSGGLDRIQAGEGVQRLVQHGAHIGGHVAQLDDGEVAQLASWMRRATVATFSASSPERSMSVSIFDTAISMQVDGRGLMPGQDVADALVDLDFVAVDFLFPLADLSTSAMSPLASVDGFLDHGHVAAGQRVDGFLDHGFHHAAHLQELRADVFQISVELLVCVLGHPGSLRGWFHCIAPESKRFRDGPAQPARL